MDVHERVAGRRVLEAIVRGCFRAGMVPDNGGCGHFCQTSFALVLDAGTQLERPLHQTRGGVVANRDFMGRDELGL